MALLTVRGTGASPGLALGQAHIHRRDANPVSPSDGSLMVLPAEEREAEVERLQRALDAARTDLEHLAEAVGRQVGADEAAVFEAQALFLDDAALTEPMEAAIRHSGQTAPAALEETLEEAARELEQLDDDYLSARAADLRDVKRRVAAFLGAARAVTLDSLAPGTIVIGSDLSPSETVGLSTETVSGIVLAEGTPAAHAAILARGLGLPLVVGAGAAIWEIEPGQRVLIDGTGGTVLIEPQAEECEDYRQQAAARQSHHLSVADVERSPARTADGRRIELMANASSVAEARLAVAGGAEGIGLLRTEFLLAALGADAPDEDALTDAYGAIFKEMGERPIIVRAMDAGGDKPLPFLDFEREANPFLGWRGIRILLDRPDVFAAQTRAVLRAAARHRSDLRLMFPMVCGLEELTAARHLVEQICAEERVELAHLLQIGVMIEVPSAALMVDLLAHEADFFSLGTNDLLQYTLACDRGNRRVSHLCRLAHPAILRLIDTVVRAAHVAGRRVGVCGEAAGDPESIALLVGLGVDELSVGAARVPATRERLSALDYAALAPLAAEALTRATPDHILSLLAPFVT